MAVAGAEVTERHFEGAAHLRVHVVHLAGESVRRQTFGDGVGFEKGPVDTFGAGAQDAVELDGSGSHGAFACQSGGCIPATIWTHAYRQVRYKGKPLFGRGGPVAAIGKAQ